MSQLDSLRSSPGRQATITLFCGLPGSGKTTLAKQLERKGHGIRICTDDWQESIGIDHSDEQFHERLQARLYEHALQLLGHGHDVILEDGLWMQHERRQKLTDARNRNTRARIHVFDVPIEQLRARLEQRNAHRRVGEVPIDLGELDQIFERFELPDSTELARFDWHEVRRA